MTFLADTNVLVDVALRRQPWVLMPSGYSTKLFPDTSRSSSLRVRFQLFYLVEKYSDTATAFAAIDAVLVDTTIIAVGLQVIASARAMPGSDFEDNVQIASAVAANVDHIVTRDPGDFIHSPIRVISPPDLLRELLLQP